MAATLTHRGPDDEGVWSDPEGGVALGFRRLSIVDLSAHGHQPMRSRTGRFSLVFNGEVYNHGALRGELESLGARFAGGSDTEVILAAFEAWGIERSIRRFVGMFAMAVWDASCRELTLVRDRLGIKPLYYYHERGLVSFGSELKALIAGPSFDTSIDPVALGAYLRYLYVPAPRCIFRGARKLLPGHLLTIRATDLDLPASRPYWELAVVARDGAAEPFQGGLEDAIGELDRLLCDAVRLRMIADVPLGALLSGGVDSSTIVSMMQEASDRPVRTFSIGFDDAVHDEAAHARLVAAHLGTEHTELVATGSDALEVVPRLAEIYDEPLADPSQIPTLLVSALARRDVTVALTGDGGDELFAGYNRYMSGEQVVGRALRVPRPARRALAAGIGVMSPDSWDGAYRAAGQMLRRSPSQRLLGEKMYKLRALLREDAAPQMYQSLLSAWSDPRAAAPTVGAEDDEIVGILSASRPAALLDRMMLADQSYYLPDDLLAKVDRASMAVGLEARVPILDHRVVEFSWRLPQEMKSAHGGKRILRQLLYRRIPRELVERPKVGFTAPIEGWLRGPLREWAEDLLSSAGTGDDLLDGDAVREAWAGFLTGRKRSALAIWTVLTYLAWRRRWLS